MPIASAGGSGGEHVNESVLWQAGAAFLHSLGYWRSGASVLKYPARVALNPIVSTVG